MDKARLLDEEWCCVVSGKGTAEVDAAEHEAGPGDFMGFAAPEAPHLLKNRGTEELVFLMGGESQPVDVVEYPVVQGECFGPA